MPVRAAFAYRKKVGRREYVRASLHGTADGGLVELGEETTRVEPGATVSFLPYSGFF